MLSISPSVEPSGLAGSLRLDVRVGSPVHFDPALARRALRGDEEARVLLPVLLGSNLRNAVDELFFVVRSAFAGPVQENEQWVLLLAFGREWSEKAVRKNSIARFVDEFLQGPLQWNRRVSAPGLAISD